MKNKCSALIIGILITGCNSNGAASKSSHQLPQVTKGVASPANKVKAGEIVGTYMCTYHDIKTQMYNQEIPTHINVTGQLKELKEIKDVAGKTVEMKLFMPDQTPNYNEIIEACNKYDYTRGRAVIDGLKVVISGKGSSYAIYNQNLVIDGKNNMAEQLNKNSNFIISNSIQNTVQLMIKASYNEYFANNFMNNSPSIIVTKPKNNMPGEKILHTGTMSDGSFRSDVFNAHKPPKTIEEIKNDIARGIFYIDSEDGFSSIQDYKSYKRYALNDTKYRMIADFIAAYDWKSGFNFAANNLTTSHITKHISDEKVKWISDHRNVYAILTDSRDDNLVHIHVAHEAEPGFHYIDMKEFGAHFDIEPGLKYITSIDYVLDVNKYKPSQVPDKFGTQEISIFKASPIQQIVIIDTSKSKETTESTKDFMRQMIFNGYQGQAGVDFLNAFGKRNNDEWVLK